MSEDKGRGSLRRKIMFPINAFQDYTNFANTNSVGKKKKFISNLMVKEKRETEEQLEAINKR